MKSIYDIGGNAKVPQVVQRRNKLAKRVWQQIELAKAQAQGAEYRVAKFKSYTDTATGVRRQVEAHVLSLIHI